MSRKLEKFIGDNRNEFDDAVPSGKVWESIAAGFAEKKKKKAVLTPLYKWSIAAALLITAGITIFLMLNNKKAATDIATATKNYSAADINITAPEFAPELNEFAKLVVLKQEELKALAPEQPELYRKFATDINQLDSSYKSLKNQLGATPNREMLIEAMIQNLQLQLNVLNQQLNIINQIKQTKKYSHEKNNQTI
jgi:HAMP domain-containing protein